MKRIISSLALAAVVAVAGLVAAQPASAASTGGYQTCGYAKLVGARADVNGFWQISVPGEPYVGMYRVTRRTTVQGYGNQQVGSWVVKADTIYGGTATGFCY